MNKSFNPAQQQFQDWLTQFQESGSSSAPEYHNPPQSITDQIDALPNSEKLTGTERWLYKTLPGFAENSAVKALANFTEYEPIAKVLRFFDYGAEGLERTLGLLAQYRDLEPGEEFRLKDAWAAGSLFWDTARLPKFARDENGRLSIRLESELPGAYAVTEARKLLSQGKTMDEIRENYYGNLGALAIRAQMQDMWGHVIADPLNFALGAIKPVQRLHAVRHLALTGKMDTKYARFLEAGFLAEGKIDDAMRMAQAIEKAESQGKALTRAERFVINLTGGTPYLKKGKEGYELLDVSKLSKGQQALARLNPFALTPQSRAGELLDMVAANVGEHLIRPNWNKDPSEFVKSLQGMARGAVGETWGHLAMTVQGRTVQGFAANAEAGIKVLAKEWDTFADERNFLARLASVLPDMNERKLWSMAKNSPKLLMERVMEAAGKPGGELLAAELQRGTLTEDLFRRIGMIDAKTPLMREEFYTRAMVIIEDLAVRQAVVQFGIKEKKALTKWADALKAWESIPFIRANPANAMRNVVNNDVTLIGRGLYGTMTPGGIRNYWKGKYMPKVFKRGFSLAGDEIEGAADELFQPGSAIKFLEETLTGTQTKADKVKQAAQNLKLGVLEQISKRSSKMEQEAGLRASTMGWMEFHQQYWNKRTGFTSITKSLDAGTLDEIERAMPGISDILDDVAQAAGADSEKFSELLQEAIETNVATVFNATEEALGYKLNDVLGADIVQAIGDGLPAAIKSGTVDTFISGLKAGVEKHVDEMFDRHVAELPGIVKAHVQAGGTPQFMRYFGKAADEFWAGNTEHAIRMSTINELIDYARSTKDYTKMRSLWSKVLADSESHFNRVWKKLSAYQDGLRQGAKEAGIKYPSEVNASFKELESGWKRFFEFRNKSYEEIIGGGDSTKSFEDLQKTLDAMYEGLAANEDKLYQRIDDLMVDTIPDTLLSSAYRNARDEIAELRKADRAHTQAFYKRIRTVRSDEAPALWEKYWQERVTRTEQIRQLEQLSSSALQGDSAALNRFASNLPKQDNPTDVWGLAQNFGISTATQKGQRNTRRLLSTVNKYLPEGTEKFKNVDDIPMEIAQQAFEARQAEKLASAKSAAEKMFIPDAEKIFPDPFPLETAISELNYGRGYAALDALVDEGIAASQKKSRLLKELPEHLQSKVMQWKKQVDGEMSSFRSAGVQYAAFRRDSALLNYNRRTNFDNMLGHIAPFAFWSTHSAYNWLLYSLDRPAMLANYLRTREFFETAGLPDQNVPSRLKGHIRVNLPFAPDWMGDGFVNPIRFALPFDGWFAPWEQSTQSKFQEQSKIERTLEDMLEKGVINEQTYNAALADQSGEAWDAAKARVKEGGESYDAMDFVTMTMTPHAPLMWAYNAARGTPNEIGPFTPMTRTVKNFATMMGVEDWSNSPYNVEGRIRKEMGLPAYDKWEDYRTQRQISNMAADGTYSMEKIREAMEVAALVESGKMDVDDAKEQSEVFKEAIRRQNVESAGGWFGAVSSMLGMPIRYYPTGEEAQRELAEQFSEAYTKYDGGDIDALTKFFDENPEYESRLALFKSPEERLKSFMIDNMWARWNELPEVTRDEVAEQLGDNFNTMFMDKFTRNYDAITPDQLQIWLALTKGKQVGRLSAEKEALIELNQLKLTDPTTAWRVQTFYDTRKSEFGDFYKLQNGYYALPEGAKRKAYLAKNPALKEYWEFRRGWMEKNPDLARYLTDDEKQLAKYARMRRDPEVAVPTAQELRSQFSPEMQELMSQGNMPPIMNTYLAQLASQYNLTESQLIGILGGQ